MPPRKSTSRQLQPPSGHTTLPGSGIPVTPASAAALSLSTPHAAKRAKLNSTTTTPMHPQPLTSASGARSGTGASAVASSSRVTLDGLPPINMPASLTPGYTKVEGEVKGLTEEERGRLIHELVGFYPRQVLDLVTEEVRKVVLEVAVLVENYVQQLASGKGSEYDLEVDIGIYAFETLLSSHIDKAFDKFTAWALRNTFDIPDDVEVVMPWCKGLDFDRGTFVAALPKGEETVLEDLEKARKKVEHMRYLSQQLERAEKVLDRRLDIARQRKGEVGFVGEALVEANLHPLAPSLAKTKSTMTALHDTLSPMASIPPASASANPLAIGGAAGQKAWEMGRQSYLSWAVGKALANVAGAPKEPASGAGGTLPAGEGGLEGVEQSLRGVGSQANLDAASRAL